MRRCRLCIVITLLCLLAVAVSADADSRLSGDVFLTMQSGDVKRAADLQVVVVPASPEFMNEWEQVQTAYEQEVAPVVSEYDGLQTQYKSLAPADTRDLRGSLQRNQLAIQLLNQMRELAHSRWVPIQDRYTKAAFDAIAKHTTATTRTDVNGHFDIASLPSGKYFVYASYSVFRTLTYWMVPVDVQVESKLSLSNSNGKRNSILRGRTYN